MEMTKNQNSMSSVVDKPEQAKWQRAVIAANRFGLGARGNELSQAADNPKKWLKSQLTPISFQDDLPHSNDIISSMAVYRQMNKKVKDAAKKGNESDISMQSMKEMKRYPREMLRAYSISYIKQAVQSEHSLTWRLLDFFSNHFSVSASGREMAGLAATLEREAIAPNLLGKFEDMLLAVSKHPAMLIYLNNERSFGPNSKMGKRAGVGLNENLAREILELHTLGVDGGYSQADVIELAKGITGWSVNSKKKDSLGFYYRGNGHEPGARVLLGKSYTQKGVKQGEAMLKDLANHPNTAKYVCFKLARHFIADKPPASLIANLEKAWLASGGNISSVMHALIDAEESWQYEKQKLKTPREFIISALRLLEIKKIKPNNLYASFLTLGQRAFNAGSPAGYEDVKGGWDGANALMTRINWSNSVSALSKVNPKNAVKNAFANTLNDHTYKTIVRAESRKQSLTLLLMSPEFQMR